MNWKNVLLLINAYVKSYRLVCGKRFRKFKENKIVTYALYISTCIFGSLVGWITGNFYSGITEPQMRALILQATVNFFISFPTIALLYGLILTQMSQFQRIGAKVHVQPLYWFPITWEEHTLASIIANILGVPLAVTLFVASGMVVASLLIDLVPLALLTIFALFVCVFMASVTTEITKVLQIRVSGAITKVAGRAAIWLRLIGSILFFIIFYTIYFSLYYRMNPMVLLEMVAGGQRIVWFIPYVWPGIALYYFAIGYRLEAILFSSASIAFCYLLFLAATKLNITYGLYEIPAIKVSTGIHVSQVGLLGRFGFTPVEAAIIRKDFKAFTRRQELAYIFIFPVVFGIMPILSTMRAITEAPTPHTLYALYSFLSAYLILAPGTIMAIMLGTMMLGLEGGSIWYFCSSPIDARRLVRAKYAFVMMFSLAVMTVCSLVVSVVWAPSTKIVILCIVEAVFLISSLSMISLSFGIRGADFRELPRPRMIRPRWAIINGLVCIILALAIVSPIIPLALNFFFKMIESPIKMSIPISNAYLYFAVPASGIIAFSVAYMFYRVALKNAEKFLAHAEKWISP